MITLGIIGIVAALTLPTLVQHHRKQVVETRLMKFYSSMNQAIKMAELDYGDKKEWYNDYTEPMYDKYGNEVQGRNKKEKWFNKYFRPYLKILRVDTDHNRVIVYFADGGVMSMYASTTLDYYFDPSGNIKRCDSQRQPSNLGYCRFGFSFKPDDKSLERLYNKGFEPYYWIWPSDFSKMTDEVRTIKDYCYGIKQPSGTTGLLFCSTVIMQNGWKIPDDYPYNVF